MAAHQGNLATETFYRIHWKALRTGATGHGTKGFPKDEAQNYADALNKNPEVNTILTHWIEPDGKAHDAK